MNDTKTVTVGGVVTALGKVLADHPTAQEFHFRRETLEALVSAPAGLRDEFAKAALLGTLAANVPMPMTTTVEQARAMIADGAYAMADAMLKAREGK